MSIEKVDNEDGTTTYTFECEYLEPVVVGWNADGDPIMGGRQSCGDIHLGQPFVSAGHQRKKDAQARADQHHKEHEAAHDVHVARQEVDMARKNVAGYEKVSTEEKQRELDELLKRVRTPEMRVFQTQIREA